MSAIAEQQNFETFEREMLNPLRGHDLTPLEGYVASLLLDASKERPIDNEMIRAAIRMQFNESRDERTIKMIIRSLRKDHSFPIVSSRKKPAGYWWCKSSEEMEEWVRVLRSQALDELHTIGRAVREHFPALAGQLRLQEQTDDE